MIDLHCHILPGVDDGPGTMDEALGLARAHVESGTSAVVATPHWNSRFRPSPEEVMSGVAELSHELDAAGIPLRIEAGSEVAIPQALDATDDELSAASMGGAGWLLVEAPLSVHAPGFHEMVQLIQARGFRILLAHPERCPEILRRPALLDELVGVGVKTQVTAASLQGAFGLKIRDLAFEMIAGGLVHNICSDAHDLEARRPGMTSAIESIGLQEAAPWWLLAVPQAILAGEPMPPMPDDLRLRFAGDWRLSARGADSKGGRRWFSLSGRRR